MNFFMNIKFMLTDADTIENHEVEINIKLLYL